MNTELTGVIVTLLLAFLLAYPLGKYIANVFLGKPTITDFRLPLERFIYSWGCVDTKRNGLEAIPESHAYCEPVVVRAVADPPVCVFNALKDSRLPWDCSPAEYYQDKKACQNAWRTPGLGFRW